MAKATSGGTYGINVYVFTIHPLIVVVLPAVKVHFEQTTHDTGNGADTDQPWVHLIGGFDLHANLGTKMLYSKVRIAFSQALYALRWFLGLYSMHASTMSQTIPDIHGYSQIFPVSEGMLF